MVVGESAIVLLDRQYSTVGIFIFFSIENPYRTILSILVGKPAVSLKRGKMTKVTVDNQ